MELPSEEDHDMPIPLNTTYVHTHHAHMMHHHDHDHVHPTIPKIPSSNGPIIIHNIPDDHAASLLPFKKTVRYKECLKNHAASMGGNATDGCGEFMPSGEEGTIEALVCSACHCHRNFHRKETDGDGDNNNNISYYNMNSRMVGRKLVLGHNNNNNNNNHGFGYNNHSGTLISSRNVAPPHMIMPYNMGGVAAPSESDEQYGGEGGGMVAARPVNQMVKKRFRTKFSQEQKDKMQSFAEKVGWKIQKQEESLVQQFCQEIGVKRRVLKVWMHNNKLNLAKKKAHQSDAQNQVLGTDD